MKKILLILILGLIFSSTLISQIKIGQLIPCDEDQIAYTLNGKWNCLDATSLPSGSTFNEFNSGDSTFIQVIDGAGNPIDTFCVKIADTLEQWVEESDPTDIIDTVYTYLVDDGDTTFTYTYVERDTIDGQAWEYQWICDMNNTCAIESQSCKPLPKPSIRLEKWFDSFSDENGNGITDVGDLAIWNYNACNDGDTDLNQGDVTLIDPEITNWITNICTDLPIGACCIAQGSSVVSTVDMGNMFVENSAFITGTDENGSMASDQSDDPSDFQNEDLFNDGDDNTGNNPDDPATEIIPVECNCPTVPDTILVARPLVNPSCIQIPSPYGIALDEFPLAGNFTLYNNQACYTAISSPYDETGYYELLNSDGSLSGCQCPLTVIVLDGTPQDDIIPCVVCTDNCTTVFDISANDALMNTLGVVTYAWNEQHPNVTGTLPDQLTYCGDGSGGTDISKIDVFIDGDLVQTTLLINCEECATFIPNVDVCPANEIKTTNPTNDNDVCPQNCTYSIISTELTGVCYATVDPAVDTLPVLGYNTTIDDGVQIDLTGFMPERDTSLFYLETKICTDTYGNSWTDTVCNEIIIEGIPPIDCASYTTDALLCADVTNIPQYGLEDCDEGGLSNFTECQGGQSPLMDIDCTILLTKEVVAVTGNSEEGDTIKYEFVVTNPCIVEQTNICVTDDNAVVIGGCLASLAAGASNSTAFTGYHVITAADVIATEVINQAEVTGEFIDPNVPGLGGTTSDTSDDVTDTTDNDSDGDGDPDDPTVTPLACTSDLVPSLVATWTDSNNDGTFDNTLSWTTAPTSCATVRMTLTMPSGSASWDIAGGSSLSSGSLVTSAGVLTGNEASVLAEFGGTTSGGITFDKDGASTTLGLRLMDGNHTAANSVAGATAAQLDDRTAAEDYTVTFEIIEDCDGCEGDATASSVIPQVFRWYGTSIRLHTGSAPDASGGNMIDHLIETYHEGIDPEHLEYITGNMIGFNNNAFVMSYGGAGAPEYSTPDNGSYIRFRLYTSEDYVPNDPNSTYSVFSATGVTLSGLPWSASAVAGKDPSTPDVDRDQDVYFTMSSSVNSPTITFTVNIHEQTYDYITSTNFTVGTSTGAGGSGSFTAPGIGIYPMNISTNDSNIFSNALIEYNAWY